MANEENNFENDDISRLLGSLKQTDPPGDFDVRVRARIAQGRPSAGRSWLPAAASVMAALLVMIAAGYFAFRSFRGPEQQTTVMPVTVQPQPVEQPVPGVSAPTAVDATRETIASTQPNAAGTNPAVKAPEVSQPKASDKESGGGSIDFSFKEGKRILPRGFNANPRINANANSFQQAGIPVNDMLKQLGLDAVSEDSGWRVRSVGGQAERSGLKAGDVVEAINDRSLVKKTSLNGTVSGKTLRVRRDGKAVDITLKP